VKRAIFIPKTRHWIPAFGGRETPGGRSIRRATGRVVANGDVVEHLRMSVLYKRDKALAMTDLQPTPALTRIGLMNPSVLFPAAMRFSLISVNMEPQRGAAEAGAADGPPLASPQDDLVLAHRGHVREAAATVVVDFVNARDVVEAAIDNDLVVGAEGKRGLDLVVVGLDRVPLIIGHTPDVAEASAAGKLGRRDLLEDLPLDGRRGRVPAAQLRAANGEDVGAGLGEGWSEDGSNVRVGWPTDAAPSRRDAIVARRENDRDALQAQLHVLVALAVLVVVGQQVFYGAVRDGDHVGWLLDLALEATLVPNWRRVLVVWICRVRAYGVGTVTGLTEGTVGAVAAVDGVEER
jgi:hypothetical protein